VALGSDNINSELHRGVAITLDDYNRSYRAVLNFPGRGAEGLLQLGLLSQGGIFDYNPDEGIMPFGNIRRTPAGWSESSIRIDTITINGNIDATPAGLRPRAFVAPRTAWYAERDYVNQMFWNAWQIRQNIISTENLEPTWIWAETEGEFVAGFRLKNGERITTIEIEFSVSNMPNGQPVPCSGNFLTCRVSNCTNCPALPEHDPDATLTIIIDREQQVIRYYADNAIDSNLNYNFTIQGNIWDIVPSGWGANDVPMIAWNPDTGYAIIAGMLQSPREAGRLIATQDYDGCADDIVITGDMISSASILGECRCDITDVCSTCRNVNCNCCSICNNRPTDECCIACGRVCGDCPLCRPNSIVTPTLTIVIDEVNNVIRYYNNTTIHGDFHYQFTISGELFEIRRPNGQNGTRWPQGSFDAFVPNHYTGETIISGIMGAPRLAGQLLATQEFEGSASDIQIRTGGAVARIDIITCTECAQVICICCEDCNKLVCGCDECSTCERAVTLCVCCPHCRLFPCTCRGLRVVIDDGIVRFFTNAEIASNTVVNFSFETNAASGNLGEFRVVNSNVDVEVSQSDDRISIMGTTNRRINAGDLIATQSYIGCGSQLMIFASSDNSITGVEMNCECGACDDFVPTLTVVIDTVHNMIRYYNNTAFEGNFGYEVNIGGAIFGDLERPDTGPRWPRGSAEAFIINHATGEMIIGGIMTDVWEAGQLIAMQPFEANSVHTISITGDAIRGIRVEGCEECRHPICACFTFERGNVLGNEEIGIQDALQILRFLVGLSSVIENTPFSSENTGCLRAYNAARSIASYSCRPTIQDALQILRLLVGLPNTLETDTPVCRQCELAECTCIAPLRVEIDARNGIIRYFHDAPLRAGRDLAYNFAVGGNGVVLEDPKHNSFDNDRSLFRRRMAIPMSGGGYTVFAAIVVDDIPAGALIAIQEFTGDPENIVFGEHPEANHPYPIGNVIIIR
jgi:hypothetical protein